VAKIKPRKYWFAVKVEFVCPQPQCKKLSTEVMYMNSSLPNPDLMAKAAQTQNFSCQHCKTLLADGTQVNLNVLPVTLEQAKAAGFNPRRGSAD
jgi:hypothetical protein